VYFDVVRNKGRFKHDGANTIPTICGLGETQRHFAIKFFSRIVEMWFKTPPPEIPGRNPAELSAFYAVYQPMIERMSSAVPADPKGARIDMKELGTVALGILAQSDTESTLYHHSSLKGLITPNNSETAVTLFFGSLGMGVMEKWVLSVLELHPDEVPMPEGRRPAILTCHETDMFFKGHGEFTSYEGPGGHATCIVIRSDGERLVWNYYNPDNKGHAANEETNAARYQAIETMLRSVPKYDGITLDEAAQDAFPYNAGVQRFVSAQYQGYCAFFTMAFIHETIVNGDLHGQHVLGFIRAAFQSKLYNKWQYAGMHRPLINLKWISDATLITIVSKIRYMQNMNYEDFFELCADVDKWGHYFTHSEYAHMKEEHRKTIVSRVTAFLESADASVKAEEGKRELERLNYINKGEELTPEQKVKVLETFKLYHGKEAFFDNVASHIQEWYSMCFVDVYNEVMGTTEESAARHLAYGKEHVGTMFSREVFTKTASPGEVGEFESFSSGSVGQATKFTVALQQRVNEAEANSESICTRLGSPTEKLWPRLIVRVEQLIHDLAGEMARVELNSLSIAESKVPLISRRLDWALACARTEFIKAREPFEVMSELYDSIHAKVQAAFAAKTFSTRRAADVYAKRIAEQLYMLSDSFEDDEDEAPDSVDAEKGQSYVHLVL
jgi:hypothetical protein